MDRAFKCGFKKIAQLGHDSHEQSQPSPCGEGEGRSPEQPARGDTGGDGCKQTGGSAFHAFFGTDGRPYPAPAELHARSIGGNVGQRGNRHDKKLFARTVVQSRRKQQRHIDNAAQKNGRPAEAGKGSFLRPAREGMYGQQRKGRRQRQAGGVLR